MSMDSSKPEVSYAYILLTPKGPKPICVLCALTPKKFRDKQAML